MPWPLLILTHLAAGAAGAVATWLVFVRPIARRVVPEAAEEPVMTKETARKITGTPTIMIVLAVVIVALGAQTLIAQREADQQSDERARTLRCLGTWATDFSHALDVRITSSGKVSRAQADREQAVDAVLLEVLRGLRRGGNIDPNRLRDRIAAFDAARRDLAAARRSSAATTAANHYPDPPSACVP